jgi:hypothetical protein
MRVFVLLFSLAWVGVVVAACGDSSGGALFSNDDGGAGEGGGNPNCPTSQPALGSACSLAGLKCTYGCAVQASCDGRTWSVVDLPVHCASDAGSDGAISCSKDSDCSNAGHPGPYSCSPGGQVNGCGICASPEYPCSDDSDCTTINDAAPPKPMVCGPGGPCTCPKDGKTGSCIPACQGPSDCGVDEACAAGHCVAKPCTTDTDCSTNGIADYACGASGTCAPKPCASDADCGGHFCVDKFCYTKAGICVPPVA